LAPKNGGKKWREKVNKFKKERVDENKVGKNGKISTKKRIFMQGRLTERRKHSTFHLHVITNLGQK
jgi:hypothetical protein